MVVNRRKDKYSGDEMSDIFDKAAKNTESAAFRQKTAGHLIHRVLGEDGDESDDGLGTEGIGQRNPGSSSIEDQRGSIKKPTGKYWTKVPVTDEEKSIYLGDHIHTQDNPLGLHSHMPGGPLSGGHSHGPGNQYGQHYHGEPIPQYGGKLVDGDHLHEANQNMPGGCHTHSPENFA